MGRRTKLLDDVTRSTILDYISRGNTVKTACLAAGITEACFYSWVQIAESGDNGNGNKVYIEFLDDLKKARRKNIAERVAKIQEAGEKPQYWPATAWLLERQEPGEFARREEISIGPSKVMIAMQELAQRTVQIATPTMLTGGEHEQTK